ncbi:MAG: choice-of-anchor J domain-containing protein [Prevotella sp.]|nr:choice-of-anchor J domain-containing protein [Prevotella sp.]
MKRILFFLSALMLTSISYAQTMDKQMQKATKKSSPVTITQTQAGKYAVTGTFKTKETKVEKQLPENAFTLKPYNKMHSLFDKFIASPAGRSLNLGKIQNTGKRNMPGMFRYNETVQSVPYSITLDSEEAFNEFMVIDNNNDGLGWEWYSSSYVRCRWNSSLAADDYLVAPPIQLEAGKNYDITVNAQSGSYTERFEIVVGTAPEAAALTTTALAPVEYNSSTPQDFVGSFVPTASGTYYVAIHCISDPDQFYLRLNSFSVKEGASTDAPAAPTVTATPGENGELSATVEVIAPKNAINDSKLTSNLTKVELYRDDQIVYEEEDVAPGATLTFADEDLTNGTHKYYAIAYNAEGPGQKSEEVSVYVGEDTPANPDNFNAGDQFSSILFTWDKVSEVGANNGYVNPANVDYNIYTLEYYEGWGFYLDELIGTVHDADSYTYDFNTEEGDQEYAYYTVTAKNVAGESSGNIGSLLLGKPYDLPLTEGFAGKTLHYFWDTDGDLLVSNASTDDDGTALIFTAEESGYTYFLSGKLNLKDATTPTLVMDVAGNVGQFYIIGLADNGEMEVLGSISVDEENISTIKVPLTSIVGEHFSQVGVYVPIQNPTEYDNNTGYTINDYLMIDNIRIYDMFADDLAISVKAPSSVQAGSSATITATVENKGDNDATSYTVSIKAGDKVLLNETVDEELPSTATQVFTAELETSIYDEASTLPIVAEVTYNADADTENNKAETQIKITVSNLLAPENLVAEVNEDNGVDLNWDAPSAGTQTVTEDFEDTSIFPTFGIGGITAEEHNGAFGDWTLYDPTGMAVYTWSSGSSYENETEPCAWQVFDPVQAGFAETSFPPASGTQFLMSMCIMPDEISKTDHWLISPELPGVAQTISFKARALTGNYGAESFEVLASTTDNNPESFVLVQDYSTTATTWEEFTADLPEGTKYFAIRHTSTDVFALFLDDITFEKAASKPTAYNIYFDEELVGTVEGDVTTFTIGADQVSDGNHNVGVTAVYDTQESTPAHTTVTIGSGWLLGDVNHDGSVNITDVALTVAYVLTKATDNFFISEANMNGDDDVNITDVTALVALVLTNQAAND